MTRILICCQGNVIRSPMAAAIMTAKSPSDWEIRSAGILVSVEDAGADHRAITELARHGFVCMHKTRQLVMADGQRFDLVLCMDRRILVRAKAILGVHRTCRVDQFDTDSVPDPGGGGQEAFALLFERLSHAAQRWVSILQDDRGVG